MHSAGRLRRLACPNIPMNMNLELVFSAAGVLAMAGWLMLLASPLSPKWSDVIAGRMIPALLSVGYVALAIFSASTTEGGYGSLQDVLTLFSHEEAMLALWVHVLVFDLLMGAWICRTARREELTFGLVIPSLLLTFLFGPAGYLTFSGLRFWARAASKKAEFAV
jgi:ABA DEFICIENT 4-like